MRSRNLRRVIPMIIVLLFVSCIGTVFGQEDDDGTKSIKAEVFIKERPTKASSRSPTARRYKAQPKSSTNLGEVPPPGMIFAQLGVTIWRFRPSTPADNTKQLIEEEAETSQWTPVRVEEGTTFSRGQRVRLSIESLSRDGYLYVINREEYADGTMGDAYLIFPTKRHAVDGNRLKAGRLIYVPSAGAASGEQSNKTRVFRIKPSGTDRRQIAEVLIILVSPKQIDTGELSNTPITLPAERLAVWQKEWTTTPVKFEMVDGAGQSMTQKEQAAGTVGAELTQDDPIPQTIYRVAIKPENPVMVTLRLRFDERKQ